MMYAKLALRNVKRSAKDYLIYVITLILSVGLFYGFMSIASPYYNESLPVKINLEILNKAMRIAVPIVALLVVFLISYVNTYMLRRKQKEFAVQTIIGMEQRTVAFIFFVETMIMGAISIIFGILLGIGLSQIVGYIVVQSFGVEWQPYLSLFPDTILFTLLFFGAIFIVMGIRNIRTVRQLKIIDMLHNSQRGNEKFTLYHQLSRWIVIAVIASIAVLGMMFALIMKVSIQPHILWQFIALVIVATLSIVAAIWFFIECRHGKSGSIPLLFLTIPCFIQGIILLILNQVFESLVRQGLAIQAYYTMPPVLAIVLLAFSILALFSNMSWILTTTIKKPSDFYYQNLFVLGQIKSKMASSAKTMGVISCILILSIVLMAWLPVNAIRASEYQKITSPFDVQVLTTYSASSLEELPKTTLDYDYITKYLNENGYPLSKAATGQLYLLQADDIDKTVKNAPLLAISVDSYNQMRALSDLPEITLDSDEYGIAWSFDTLPETITQFNQEVSSIHAGNSTLHKKSGADYQDPTGMVLFTSRMQAVYIIPDEICNNLLMATSFYAGNTEKPLAYDFAERFDQEMWKYQFNLGVFSENQLYVRLGTLQDNEGISNALLLRLVGAYAALVLIIICFTILSVQQLTDTIEQKKRFQIISKLGVNKSDCGRYPIGIHELYLIEVLPNGPTQRQITFVSVPLLISLTAILLLGCSLAFLLHRMIAHPISALQSRIEKISGGDFSADPDIEWDNELGDIGRGINSMSAGVTALMEHRLEDEKQKQDLEYRMLQNQINPHFIYNTLNSIKWMATIQHAPGIAEMVMALSRLLKSISKSNERLVPLYEEFALLNDYFTIQQYRYGGTITLDVSYIEDESLNHSCLIPRFTLQPLVENAIFHGIEPKGSAGEVTLRVERDTANGDVLIHLTDDGVGMTPEQAAKALQEPGPEEAAAKYRHVGMWNVHKRLQYSFGEAYGLSIESEPDIGTTVTIRLPGPDSQK